MQTELMESSATGLTCSLGHHATAVPVLCSRAYVAVLDIELKALNLLTLHCLDYPQYIGHDGKKPRWCNFQIYISDTSL